MMLHGPGDIELNELFGGRLKILQKKRGYRFSIDAVLLAQFVIDRAAGTVVDLGAGSGVLPIILARHRGFEKIIGIEIQEDLALLARKNIDLNGCQDRVQVIHADIRSAQHLFGPEGFETVIANPPFYTVGSGRINPDSQKAAARHEIHGTLLDFIAGASFLLKQRGRFMAVYGVQRLNDLIAGMRSRNLEPKTLQLVHPRIDEPASMVLIEGIKGAGTELKVLPPLVIFTSRDTYTRQVRTIFARV